MIFRIDYRRLILLSALLGLLILLVRGCLFACAPEAGEIHIETDAKPVQILRVYDADRKTACSMPLEEYLVGVVAAEMPVSFQPEALRAQAVAARTFTLWRMGRGGCQDSGCDVCSDSGCCQAFDSEAACREKWGGDYEQNRAKVEQAVNATAGEALYYRGELIEALYHAASGGYTEDSQNVFGGDLPYLKSVESRYETGSSHMTDSVTMSRRAFAKAVNGAWGEADLHPDRLEDQVNVEERFDSGRVKSIQLGGAYVTGRELRGLLELSSANFTISFTKEEVNIETKGYGHGVGMSQTGANGMAEQGADYREILTHYYTGVEIR